MIKVGLFLPALLMVQTGGFGGFYGSGVLTPRDLNNQLVELKKFMSDLTEQLKAKIDRQNEEIANIGEAIAKFASTIEQESLEMKTWQSSIEKKLNIDTAGITTEMQRMDQSSTTLSNFSKQLNKFGNNLSGLIIPPVAEEPITTPEVPITPPVAEEPITTPEVPITPPVAEEPITTPEVPITPPVVPPTPEVPITPPVVPPTPEV